MPPSSKFGQVNNSTTYVLVVPDALQAYSTISQCRTDHLGWQVKALLLSSDNKLFVSFGVVALLLGLTLQHSGLVSTSANTASVNASDHLTTCNNSF